MMPPLFHDMSPTHTCMRTHGIGIKEMSGIDSDEKHYKTYALGVSLIQDEALALADITIWILACGLKIK